MRIKSRTHKTINLTGSKFNPINTNTMLEHWLIDQDFRLRNLLPDLTLRKRKLVAHLIARQAWAANGSRLVLCHGRCCCCYVKSSSHHAMTKSACYGQRTSPIVISHWRLPVAAFDINKCSEKTKRQSATNICQLVAQIWIYFFNRSSDEKSQCSISKYWLSLYRTQLFCRLGAKNNTFSMALNWNCVLSD